MRIRHNQTTLPWEKPLDELSQFDWLTAVGQSPAHRDSPTDLRCAQEIARFCSGELQVAWPTVETLATYMGCHRSSASRAIANLKRSGALTVGRIADLSQELSKQIARNGRGNVYAPNMRWAADLFEMRGLNARREPAGLKSGREKQQTNVAGTFTIPRYDSGEVEVATTATMFGANPATSSYSDHRDANIDNDIDRNRIGAGKGKRSQSQSHGDRSAALRERGAE